MMKYFLNSPSLKIIRMDFTIITMKRMGDRTETIQKVNDERMKQVSVPMELNNNYIVNYNRFNFCSYL